MKSNHSKQTNSIMNTSTKYNQFDYTDQELIGEGDWDDCLSPDEYEEVLERKRFNQSMGRPAWTNVRPNYRNRRRYNNE